MPRGRKKKFKLSRIIKPEVVKSLAAMFFILFSGLSLISFFAPDYSINAYIQEGLTRLFGYPSFLLPFIFLFLGLMLIHPLNFKYKNPRVLIGLISLMLSSSGLFHIFYSGSEAYDVALNGGGGGMFGYKLADTLRGAVSVWGGLLVLIAAFAGSVILLFNVSLDQMVEVLNKVAGKFKEGGFKLPSRGGEAGGGDITVSAGHGVLSADLGEDVGGGYVEPTVPVEAKIEIIPSMSEPQAGLVNGNRPDGTAGMSLAHNLPYSDKVWENPPLDLLFDAPDTPVDRGDVKGREKKIIDTLKSFDINVKVADIQYGPSVTQYALEAETGTKISKIASLQYDLALALASPTGSVRIEAPIPGKSLIGIEVPNNTRVNVNFKSLLSSEPMRGLKSKLGIVMGKDVGGNVVVYDIAKMPHLLVAGATGSGKSVFLHSVIFSMLYRANPNDLRFIMIDPKRTELIHYQDIPHLATPVITDVAKAPSAFRWAVQEMERRYKSFENAKARNIETYNEMSGFQAMPYIIIVVDELAEIMLVDPASVEKSIIRIAQLARATGIHLILAVQRPSTNIITGLIKANIPSRIAFNVASQVDSRVIIDQPGAEKLLGKGDMLFVPPDAPKPTRLQGAFVNDREISNLVNYLKSQGVPPQYDNNIIDMNDKPEKSISAGGESTDEYFDEAVDIVTSLGKASASLLQRRLSIGYARAARILDELEEKSIIGPANGAKPRNILVKSTNIPQLDTFDDSELEEL
ncbi:MAG: segregation ATPase FtsK/SpoIIIE [candidate division WWE3 bacterium GW2011_GWC1_41_7]|uniref:Segregation ATPase FtsK/SpoIIIE n=3 Tax=Katanobacteria TaxID=422282 RepID=A0A0G0X8V3_UNCKA|nr:MAG: segregation ATPase FtsK/SpoIIIE [candidate division WWE3 bacterium GW2011_GWB1_41_6]KKS20822.1 MAG: segregation ATPase FtsK/SpoIIIE [candidate division WWE3 bacterium GW2011_GWC1_41_7]OGC58335.1 MAG: hypothetical protein A2976_03220 [candidate division WWE3 bacterium RIFCSPLOWO2_01_FULL_41_9]